MNKTAVFIGVFAAVAVAAAVVLAVQGSCRPRSEPPGSVSVAEPAVTSGPQVSLPEAPLDPVVALSSGSVGTVEIDMPGAHEGFWQVSLQGDAAQIKEMEFLAWPDGSGGTQGVSLEPVSDGVGVLVLTPSDDSVPPVEIDVSVDGGQVSLG